MTDIRMPRLSDSMEQGTVLTWLVADGDTVSEGQDLVEIETDKATMTHGAECGGVVSIVAPAGSTVAVGEVIARVGDEVIARVGDEGDSVPSPAEPVAASRNGHVDQAPVPATAAATPMAQRIARRHGIAIEGLRGTGPRGRVVRADVMRAAGLATAPAAPTAPPPSIAPPPSTAPTTPAAGGERVELSRLQQTVARRMAEAKATIPHFQVQTEVEMSSVLGFRAQLKELNAQDVPSLNDLIVKACALCLRRHPRANGAYADRAFQLHERVNVAIAVAAEDALVVPVVHDADRLSLGEIARATRRLAERVRTGAITPPELSGATFTVSNLGMYQMTAIAPVINPPQAAILGVGVIRQTLARSQDGGIVDRPLLTLTLSCDHRILYGADAARFLADIRALLQAPAGLAL